MLNLSQTVQSALASELNSTTVTRITQTQTLPPGQQREVIALDCRQTCKKGPQQRRPKVTSITSPGLQVATMWIKIHSQSWDVNAVRKKPFWARDAVGLLSGLCLKGYSQGIGRCWFEWWFWLCFSSVVVRGWKWSQFVFCLFAYRERLGAFCTLLLVHDEERKLLLLDAAFRCVFFAFGSMWVNEPWLFFFLFFLHF